MWSREVAVRSSGASAAVISRMIAAAARSSASPSAAVSARCSRALPSAAFARHRSSGEPPGPSDRCNAVRSSPVASSLRPSAESAEPNVINDAISYLRRLVSRAISSARRAHVTASSRRPASSSASARTDASRPAISQRSHPCDVNACSHAASHARSTLPISPSNRSVQMTSARAFIHGMLNSDGPSRSATIVLRSSASSSQKMSRSVMVE